MSESSIIITVGKDGNFTIEVDGVKGSSCTSLTKDIIKSLGIKTDEKLKTEFYNKEDKVDILSKNS
jgi:hypothetical protein